MNPFVLYGLQFIISWFIIFWLVTGSDVNKIEHIYSSLNKFYIALFGASLSGFAMSSVALLFSKRQLPFIIPIIFIFLAAAFLSLIRLQAGINNTEWTRAMIQHHSRAIFTSKWIKRRTKDPFIEKLAGEIIKSQEKEIREMEEYLNK